MWCCVWLRKSSKSIYMYKKLFWNKNQVIFEPINLFLWFLNFFCSIYHSYHTSANSIKIFFFFIFLLILNPRSILYLLYSPLASLAHLLFLLCYSPFLFSIYSLLLSLTSVHLKTFFPSARFLKKN